MAERMVLRWHLVPNEREPRVIALPVGSEVLSVGSKPGCGSVSLWTLCPTDSESPKCWLRFWCVGTGWPLTSPHLKHVGTTVSDDGYVWHVFQELTEAEVRHG